MPSQFYDNQSNEISDHLGSDPDNNTVRYAMDQIYPAVSSDNTSTDTSDATPIKKQIREQRTEDKFANQSILGSPYSGPIGWTERLMGLANFFKPAEKGNAYTDSFKKPQPNQPTQAVDPNTYYAKWYESMRRFAEAEEVANRGQTTVRSR